MLATMGLARHRRRPDHPHRRGLDFLGWRIQRHRKKGTSRHYVYVYPSTKAVLAVKRKIKTLGRAVEPNQPLDDLLRRINSTLRAGRLFPGRGVLGDLLPPESLRVADGMATDAP